MSRILITGGYGFLGSAVYRTLSNQSESDAENSGFEVIRFRSNEFDLLNRASCQRLLRETRPAIVVHLAATAGGIGLNNKYPGSLFYNNMVMGTELIEACRAHAVKHFIFAGTVCSYPRNCQLPFSESDFWNGYPEETNSAYGIAKKALMVQLEAYRQQYGFSYTSLLFANLYGPEDNFNPETSHVIPALIRKFHEAKQAQLPEVSLWGTGSASREFLYVEDAAHAVRLALEAGPQNTALNIGANAEMKISELAETLKNLVGFHGGIVWDRSRPDGQPRRRLDVTKARALLRFNASTDIHQGLARTYSWFQSQNQVRQKSPIRSTPLKASL